MRPADELPPERSVVTSSTGWLEGQGGGDATAVPPLRRRRRPHSPVRRPLAPVQAGTALANLLPAPAAWPTSSSWVRRPSGPRATGPRDSRPRLWTRAGRVVSQRCPTSRWCREASTSTGRRASSPTPPTQPILLTTRAAEVGQLKRAHERAQVVLAGDTTVDLAQGLAALAGQGARLVLCEGGPTLNGELASAGLIDELCLTVAPSLVGGGGRRSSASAGLTTSSAPRSCTCSRRRAFSSSGTDSRPLASEERSAENR